jgi:hypothetical protein
MSDDGLVFREVMELDDAQPEQVLRFVMTAERVMEYYMPPPKEWGELEAGRSFWASSDTSVTLVELVEEQSNDDRVVIFVTVAMGVEPPYTLAGIKAAPFFTMYEDWDVAPSASGGTTLTKSWRDLDVAAEVPFPLEDSIRESAKAETAPLIEKWNEAARAER